MRSGPDVLDIVEEPAPAPAAGPALPKMRPVGIATPRPAATPEPAEAQPQSVTIPVPPPVIPAPMPVIHVLPSEPKPLFAMPAAPASTLTDEGRALIIEFEVGGRSGYNPHPEWPEAASGVTIGIGYDLRFNSRAVIRSDWGALPARDLERLVGAQGLAGQEARARADALRDITIPWATALRVFEQTTVIKFDQLSRRTYPGYDILRGHAQDSLLSLTFNRGNNLVGERRRHMRRIAELSPRQDYDGMAGQERAMVTIWAGTPIESGMRRRRYAEAALMEMP